MSKETAEWLNGGNILVGYDAPTWWRNDDLIADLGIESPFYPGAVPVEAVRTRLLDFEVASFPSASLRPVTGDTDPSVPTVQIDGQTYRVVVDDKRKAVGPTDADATFGVFSNGYDTENHQFKDVLLAQTANILDDDLGIESAGLLSNRAVAWVTVSVPHTTTTPDGVEFRPRLTAASSFDGTIASQWARAFGLPVCDNTLAGVLAEQVDQKIKVRHTRHSGLRIADAREALAIVHTMSDEFSEAINELCSQKVTQAQWDKVLDALVPMPEEEGRALTVASNKRDALTGLYGSDPRCEPWKGTRFGVLQTFNTFDQHFGTVRGETHRAEKNMLSVINGGTAKKDATVLDTLSLVCA
jgi:phage/plasmid-like protein (TIGR03299 family)